MRKKSGIFFLCIFCWMLCLSGCTQAISLTDQEQNEIAEYIAYLLLKHDRGYESSLAEEITVTENPSIVDEEFAVIGEDQQEKEPSGETGQTTAPEQNETGENAELKEIFTAPDIQVTFAGCEEHDTYPEGDEESYFSLVTPEGKKLAVMKFKVHNLSEKERTFRQLDTEVRYRLDLDAATIVKPSMTLLLNDLQYMDVVLEPGEEREAVVVFAVDREARLKGANLLVYTETKTAIEKVR